MLKRLLRTLCAPFRSKGGDVLRGTVADVRLSFFPVLYLFWRYKRAVYLVVRSTMKFVCKKYMFETNNPYNETRNNFVMSRKRK